MFLRISPLSLFLSSFHLPTCLFLSSSPSFSLSRARMDSITLCTKHSTCHISLPRICPQRCHHFLCVSCLSRLGICRLSSAACEGLSTVLQLNRHLRELDLSFNDLGDRGMGLLCEGLRHPTCRLQKLWWVAGTQGWEWWWSLGCQCLLVLAFSIKKLPLHHFGRHRNLQAKIKTVETIHRILHMLGTNRHEMLTFSFTHCL